MHKLQSLLGLTVHGRQTVRWPNTHRHSKLYSMYRELWSNTLDFKAWYRLEHVRYRMLAMSHAMQSWPSSQQELYGHRSDSCAVHAVPPVPSWYLQRPIMETFPSWKPCNGNGLNDTQADCVPCSQCDAGSYKAPSYITCDGRSFVDTQDACLGCEKRRDM
mmetsp:Transcript_37263/g.54667  ORF Transcript_37263/g.54667 Transcript_37263/m.54667 type:complete len:161 (+) Transcript_37263:1130-1612(+)